MKAHFKGLMILALMALPILAFSQIITKRINFPYGKSSTVVAGAVRGYQTIDYIVNAKAGQHLSVKMTTNKGSNYFNILEPNSNDVAIYTGDISGNNYSGTLNQSGNYKIRVYLMRSDARRNVTANFKLSVAVTGTSSNSNSGGSSEYSATGICQSYYGDSGTKIETRFGVKRINSNHATVRLMMPSKNERVVVFDRGTWSCTSPNCSLQWDRVNGDDWKLTINEMEVYILPDAIITGG